MFFIPAIAEVGITLAASKALTKYLSPVKKLDKTYIPIVRKKPSLDAPTRSKTERIADYASLVADMSIILKNSKDELTRSVSKSTKQLEITTADKITTTSKALERYKNSPLLANQILQKQSMDALVNVFERFLLRNQELMAPIGNSLVSIDTSLGAINTTLMEFSTTLGSSSSLMKSKLELETTPRNLYDFDGNLIKSDVSPLEIKLMKDASVAKGETDENNIGGDLIGMIEDIYDSDALNALRIFSYFGFSESTSRLNDSNDDGYLQALNNWKAGNK